MIIVTMEIQMKRNRKRYEEKMEQYIRIVCSRNVTMSSRDRMKELEAVYRHANKLTMNVREKERERLIEK